MMMMIIIIIIIIIIITIKRRISNNFILVSYFINIFNIHPGKYYLIRNTSFAKIKIIRLG